ncbi:hypothetical protein ACIBEJ_50710 [Nonomuraea sp. NPDC050790]|uniref:hypothetical protein n=1 Tax=Nonomuraea sp. NPDC050790 TaxID=3364371 RepID=UPI0037B56AE4
MLLRRVATLLGTALLAVPLMAAPAYAGGVYDCANGDRTPDPTGAGYYLGGRLCGGSGIGDVDVHIKAGPAAGHYRCETAFFFVLTGNLAGVRCRLM